MCAAPQSEPPPPGACGYGSLPSGSWPFGNTASLDPATSPFALSGSSMSGCGICLEVQCSQAVSLAAERQHASAPSASTQPLPQRAALRLTCLLRGKYVSSPAPIPQAGCAAGTTTVLVTDWCESCGPDTVFVSTPAFHSVVSDQVGQASGQFRQVGGLGGWWEVALCGWARVPQSGFGEQRCIGCTYASPCCVVQCTRSESPDAPCLQVPCNPPSGIAVHVDSYRATQVGCSHAPACAPISTGSHAHAACGRLESRVLLTALLSWLLQGGWIRLALVGVAGSGDITSVEIKGSSQARLSVEWLAHARHAVHAMLCHTDRTPPICEPTAHAHAGHPPPSRLLQPDSAYKPMTRTFGATWEASNLPQPPLDLRISSAGQQVIAKWVPGQPEGGVAGAVPAAAGAPAAEPLPVYPRLGGQQRAG